MNASKLMYDSLCKKGKIRKYTKNIHYHHIIPKHAGGTDDPDNITNLTIREHKIAHYLLWRINKNPNDLRSYYMLGGNLTSLMRKTIGKWCFNNKIGIFNPNIKKQKKNWAMKGIKKQISKKIGIFDPSKFLYHASLGGKASAKKNKMFQYWHSKEGQKFRASLGGKSHKGKKAMYKPGSKRFYRVTPDKWNDFLNKGFIFGSPIKSNKGKKFTSKRKKKVTNGNIVYESVFAAAKANNVTSSCIIHRIKSSKTNWNYFYDI